MISTPSDLKTYRKDLKRALQNQFLGNTLDHFATAYRASRTKAFEGIDLDYPHRRNRPRQGCRHPLPGGALHRLQGARRSRRSHCSCGSHRP